MGKILTAGESMKYPETQGISQPKQKGGVATDVSKEVGEFLS